MSLKNPTYYAVVAVDSGRPIYCGRSVSEAAIALTPGTVWGQGCSRFQAKYAALTKRDQLIATNRHE